MGGSIFHLAIPCADLDAAEEFYVDGLGCRIGRRMADRITLDFFGDQVVCHLAPDRVDPEPTMYPRHFGRTFDRKSDFDALLQRAEEQGLSFFQPLSTRFGGRKDEHLMFFLKDPSNNLLEFKYYLDAEMRY